MASNWLNALLDAEFARRRAVHLFRQQQPVHPLDAIHLELDGRRLVNFASNNYLGLSHHPRVLSAARAAFAAGGGSGASGLISGHTTTHAHAEAALAAWKGTEAALLLHSGYQSSHAVIQTFAGIARFHAGGVRFLTDKLSHASLIDAIQGSQAPWRIFPHNHLGKLERLLRDAPEEQVQVVVTESIFSMDGDAAALAGLAELKERYRFALVLDEAHGSGVYGPDGAGYAAEQGLSAAVDVSIATLSKALGLWGGAVCASRRFCDAMLNWGRAYIYSTSVSPVLAAGVTAALEVLHQEPQRQARVRQLAARVRQRLSQSGLVFPMGDSPIVPVILGNEAAALVASQRLREEGLLVAAIRPPTVPRSTSRLRITLSCEHTDEEVEHLIQASERTCGRSS